MSLDELDELHDSLARARQRIETSDRRVHVLEIELRGVRELLAKEQKRRRVEDRLLTRKQALEIFPELGSVSSIRRLNKSGQLPWCSVVGRIRMKKSDIHHFIDSVRLIPRR